MKSLFVLAAVGALIAAAPALADDHHDHDGAPPAAQAGGHGAPNAHAAGPAAHPDNHMARPAGSMSGPMAPANHGAMSMQHNAHPAVNNAMMHHGPAANNAMQNHAMRSNAMHSNAMQNNAMRSNAMQNNTMRHAPAMQHGAGMHANLNALHRNFNAPHRYHAGAYHRPTGYYAHRWVFGERLPAAFFARNYWLTDFGAFGLIPPPPGCVWVRYGDDALLIDEYTGEVIQVEYGVFF